MSATPKPENVNPVFDVWRQPQQQQQRRQKHDSQPEVRPQPWAPPIFFFGACGILVAAAALFYWSLRSSPTLCQNSSLTSPSPPPFFKTTPISLQTPHSSQNPVKSANTDKMSTSEQTFIAIKPDGVQRGLVGPIISRFENRGYKLVAIKLITPGKEHLEKHYADLKGKPFFPGLIEYMNSGPICAMVWEGIDAVKTGRVLLGATNPLASAPGTIRGDYSLSTGRNVCHGSDSVENAKKEIALWFKDGDLVSYKSAQHDWIYEN